MTSSAPKPAVSNTRHDDVITTSIISRHSIYLLIFIIVLILLWVVDDVITKSLPSNRFADCYIYFSSIIRCINDWNFLKSIKWSLGWLLFSNDQIFILLFFSDPHRSLDDVLREHLETISFKLDLLKQRSEEDRIWMQDNLNNQNLMITNLYDKVHSMISSIMTSSSSRWQIAKLMTNSTIHSWRYHHFDLQLYDSATWWVLEKLSFVGKWCNCEWLLWKDQKFFVVIIELFYLKFQELFNTILQ